MHDAVASYPWVLTPIERQRICFQQHIETVEDFGSSIPAALASIRVGEWNCVLVTSDWAMPRCLIAAAQAPSWCRLQPHPILTELTAVDKLSNEQLKEGSQLGRWAVALPEDWDRYGEHCSRHLFVIGRNMRKWVQRMASDPKRATSQAKLGTPFSKHEQAKRAELFEILSTQGASPGTALDETRQVFADILGEFYDAEVAVAQHPLHASSSKATLLHQCAAAGALELASDLVSFWGADVEALDDNGLRPVELVDNSHPRGALLTKMLFKFESGALFAPGN